jgi:DNA polymerase-3 subunit delta
MKLRYDQLNAQLNRHLAAVYLISGDDICLCETAKQSIRHKANAEGYSEREVITIDTHFNWDNLQDNLASFSLFSSRRLVELHIANGKPGDAGSRFIQQYVANPNPDCVLIFLLPKVESASTKSKWWQAIETHGVALQIWPLDLAARKQWLQQQLRQFNFTLDAAALDWLLQQTAGNLLATQQEVQKLGLVFAPGDTITLQHLQEILTDAAEFDVFDLVDNMNAGKLAASQRVLQKLQVAGIEPILILWALTRELRQLYQMLMRQQTGVSTTELIQQLRLPLQRKAATEAALQRFTLPTIENLLADAATMDGLIKGQTGAPIWHALTQFCLTYCGAKV